MINEGYRKVTPSQSLIHVDSHKPQGGGGIAKKEQGSIFFELPSELGLPNYVSGRLPIYGNGVSIYV